MKSTVLISSSERRSPLTDTFVCTWQQLGLSFVDTILTHCPMKTLCTPLLLLLLLVSCKKDDDNSASNASDFLVQGSWRITLYNDSGNDETDHFTGYVFTFSSNGGLTASNGSTSVPGTWSTGSDDSQKKLYLTFNSPPDFNELSDDWHILEETSTKIRLEDVSGGNGGTDLLTFEKN